MNFRRSLLAEVKLFTASLGTYIFSFLLYPLMFVVFFGFTFSFIFSADFSFEISSIYVEDEDGGEEAELMLAILESEEMAEYVSFADEAEVADFVIRLTKGFGQPSEMAPPVSIIGKAEISSMRVALVTQVMENLVTQIRQVALEEELAGRHDLDGDTLLDLQTRIGAEWARSLIETKSHKGEGAFTSYEYYGIASIWYISMMMASIGIAGSNDDKLSGVRKRTRMLPQSMESRVLVDYILSMLISLIFALAYILIVRHVFGGFQAPIGQFLLVFALQVSVYIVLGVLLGVLFPQAITNVVSSVIMLFLMMLGGVMPTDKLFTGIKIPVQVTEFAGNLSSNPYFSVEAGQLDFIPGFALACVLLTLVGLGATILVNRLRKEL